MGVLFGIAIGVVHPVKNGIGPGVQKGRPLRDEGKGVKEFLPELIHLKHLMRGVAVQEESLREKGQKPVAQKKH